MRLRRDRILRGGEKGNGILSASRIILLAGALFALAACGQKLDANAVLMCRMTLPALNAPDADIRITRINAGAGEREIRIDYTVVVERGAQRRRFVICGFNAVPRSTIEPDLASLVTETGPVSGASVHLMKRFWLRTPEAFEADPGQRG